MSYISIILLGIGLAMDAFSVSVSKGLTCKKNVHKTALACGITFGFFQGIMPLIGWLIGSRFASIIDKYSGYVGFAILGFIGGKMIFDAIKGDEYESGGDLTLKTLLVLGIATSIDALAVGVTFVSPELGNLSAFMTVLSYCLIIAVITFVFSFFGCEFGKKLKNIIGSKAEIFGGIVLCIIGIKLLFETII